MFLENFYKAANDFKNQPAIITSNNVITYQDLEVLVDRMRRALRSSNISLTRTPVMLLGNRDEYMVALMLALYFERIPYIPLSEQYPLERIEYIAQKVNTNLLLSNNRDVIDRFKSTQFETFEIFDLPADYDFQVDSNIKPTTAYVIFTSGSTGSPKGVEINYNSLESFLKWVANFYDTKDFELLFAGTEITFDLSVFEIYGTLNFGGTFIFGKSILELPSYEYHGVTMLNTVPSAIRELALAKKIPASLRKINLAGEALSKSVISTLRNINSELEIINLYGPTEDTTYSTYFPIPRNFNDADIPIGRPVSGVNVLVFNNEVGFTKKPNQNGEIIITGDLLANGYINDIQKTNESFQYLDLKDQNKIKRFYKTGDLGFYDTNGLLHFLGRSDSQVKYHGYRIELREIEILAERNEKIKKAVALIQDDNLTLYYSLNENNDDYAKELQVDLANKVPEYMVPKKFVLIERWPLNGNGKIDRTKLLDGHRMKTKHNVRNYPNLESNTVVKIWETILEIPVDDTTHFFKDGGNSIKAMRLVAEISRHLKREIKLSDVFQNPRLSDFLKMLERSTLTQSNIDAFTMNDFQKRLMLQYDASPNGDEYVIKFQLNFKQKINVSLFSAAMRNTIPLWPHLTMKVKRVNNSYIFEKSKTAKSFQLQIDDGKEEPNINPYKDDFVSASYSKDKKIVRVFVSHLVFDGYSVNVFVSRLMEQYRKLLLMDMEVD